MTTLLRMLEPSSSNGKAADVSSKPIIILLDEFDLFAQHPRQSFLYCLLDIVQGNRRKKGMGVIGISARSVSFRPASLPTPTPRRANTDTRTTHAGHPFHP